MLRLQNFPAGRDTTGLYMEKSPPPPREGRIIRQCHLGEKKTQKGEEKKRENVLENGRKGKEKERGKKGRGKKMRKGEVKGKINAKKKLRQEREG